MILKYIASIIRMLVILFIQIKFHKQFKVYRPVSSFNG